MNAIPLSMLQTICATGCIDLDTLNVIIALIAYKTASVMVANGNTDTARVNDARILACTIAALCVDRVDELTVEKVFNYHLCRYNKTLTKKDCRIVHFFASTDSCRQRTPIFCHH